MRAMESHVFAQLLNEFAGLVGGEGLIRKASAEGVAAAPAALGALRLEGIAAVASIQLAVGLPNSLLVAFIRSSWALQGLTADALVAKFGGQAGVKNGAWIVVAARRIDCTRRVAGRESCFGEDVRKRRKFFCNQLRFQFSNESEIRELAGFVMVALVVGMFPMLVSIFAVVITRTMR
jgi:hypothetical protein